MFSTEAPPAEIYISEYQESTGFFYHTVSVIFSAFRSDCQCIGDCELARDFAVTDWLTVIYRYFGGNPDEGSDFISK